MIYNVTRKDIMSVTIIYYIDEQLLQRSFRFLIYLYLTR